VREWASTLAEALTTGAAQRATLSFHLEDGQVSISGAELADRAMAGARVLAARGIGPGDAVGVLGPNRPEWAVWAWATWVAGATFVPLQIPLRVRDPEAFAEQVRSLIYAAGCRLVLADPRLVGIVGGDACLPWDEPGSPPGADPVLPGPDDPAVIQFTSGSTAAPKGALVSHRAVMAQMELIDHWTPGSIGGRVVVGWVPFFHDLGLFYYVVAPVVFGGDAHYLPTERFASDPVEWLRLVTATRANITVAPGSAIGAAVRSALKRSDPIDLSSLEFMRFAAEGVDPEFADQLREAAGRLKLPLKSLGSSYGLAEAVLGVTSASELHDDRVDVEAMTRSGLALPATGDRVRRVVSAGRTGLTTEVRIVEADGAERREREIGEICVRGPSIMDRYVGAGAPDPFDEDGWLRTGDLGYLAEGELYVTGRIKDLMIVMGHNYYPEDFEWAAGRLDGVRAGRCVAFGSGDGEEVVLLVEPSGDSNGGELTAAVRHAVRDAVGVAPRRVVVLPPGSVEKTTSGKLRRSAMRSAYLRGDLPVLAADE
jgi:fatty-acyl-CoA synthase